MRLLDASDLVHGVFILKEVPLSRQIFLHYHTQILLFSSEMRKQLQGLRKRTALDFAARKMMPHLKMRWRG